MHCAEGRPVVGVIRHARLRQLQVSGVRQLRLLPVEAQPGPRDADRMHDLWQMNRAMTRTVLWPQAANSRPPKSSVVKQHGCDCLNILHAADAKPEQVYSPAITCGCDSPAQARAPWYSSHSSTPNAQMSTACSHAGSAGSHLTSTAGGGADFGDTAAPAIYQGSQHAVNAHTTSGRLRLRT